MKTFDATSAKNRFGRLLEACRDGPVAIERHGRVVAYVLAPGQLAEDRRALPERLAERLRAAGARYATLFGSLAAGTARAESDIDVAVAFGAPMSADLRAALIGIVADAAGRPVDLVDLEAAQGLVLLRALQGSEILCDAPATRERMIRKLLRAEDEQRSVAPAVRAARAKLFA